MMCHHRQNLPYGVQIMAAQRLCRTITSTAIYQQSQHIACYLAVKGEINLKPLIKHIWSSGKKCYLPVIDGKDMSFVLYRPGSLLKPNRFGILEPTGVELESVSDLELVLMPLVAFDVRGHRLGMGGGFYDRAFADTQYSGRTFLMGVAHRCQQAQSITPQPWDVAMDRVVTA